MCKERPACIMNNEPAPIVDLGLSHDPQLMFLWVSIARVVPLSSGIRRRNEGGRARARVRVAANSSQDDSFSCARVN